MAFVNLDLTSDDAIISFCNKYGLITAEHTAEQVTNDDLYLESVKNDPLTKLQRASHEEGIGGLVMPMCDFKSAAVALRKLIELKRAISHNDIVKVLLTIAIVVEAINHVVVGLFPALSAADVFTVLIGLLHDMQNGLFLCYVYIDAISSSLHIGRHNSPFFTLSFVLTMF